MTTLRDLRLEHGLSLADVASRLGVTRATVQDYERSDARGSIRSGTRDRVLAAIGAGTTATTPDQARSLILHTAVAAQLLLDPERVLAIARANVRRLSGQGRHDQHWLDRWARVLERSPGEIALLLTERSQDAADLRQSSPFAGALSGEQRLAALERGREAERALAA